MKKTTIKDSKVIELPIKRSYRGGSITPIYNHEHVPFAIERVYYLYDVPAGSHRGGHAHKQLQQLIVAVSGSFDIILKDGQEEKKISLNQPFYGLFLPTMIWRELDNFSSGAICLVLASLSHDEEDYDRDYNEFIRAKCQK